MHLGADHRILQILVSSSRASSFNSQKTYWFNAQNHLQKLQAMPSGDRAEAKACLMIKYIKNQVLRNVKGVKKKCNFKKTNIFKKKTAVFCELLMKYRILEDC